MVSISIANREANVKNNRSARFLAATSPTDTATPTPQKNTRSCRFDELTTQEAWFSTSPEGRALTYVEAAPRYHFCYNRDKNRYSGKKAGQPESVGLLVSPLE